MTHTANCGHTGFIGERLLRRRLDVHVLHVSLTDGTEVATPTGKRVAKRRLALRRSGLWPVQIWVPDTRRAGFAVECRRQCGVVAQSDAAEAALDKWLDATTSEIEGWTA